MPLQQIAITNAVNAVVNNFTGQRIAMPNGNYLGECTAPVCWYLHYLGLPIPPMHNNRADGWGVANPSELQPYFTFEPYQPNKAYEYGTIFMWDSPHIAICLHSDGNNTATVFEQNADPDGSVCGTKTRTMANQWHKPTYVMIPRIDAVPEVPYTITPVDPYKVDVIAGHQKWDLSHPDFASVAGNPVLTLNQQTTITVAAELHHKHIGDYTYLLEDPNVPQGYNRLDTVPYVPPAPIYVPPAAPVPVPLATKVTIVADVPYYSTATNAQNAYKEAGRLPAGQYYQITKDFGMLNLSTDNTKDLQHWVNPRDNVPAPAPIPEPLPVTKAPVIGDESGSWRGTYRAFPAKEVYLAIHNYLVSDIGGVRPAMKLNRYDPSISQVDGRVAVYGTFTGPDGVKYYRLRDPRDTEFTAYYGIPILDSNGMPILMKQPIIRVATPAALPRKVSHKDTIHLLGSYLAEIEPKFIDILPRWYKSKNNKKG